MSLAHPHDRTPPWQAGLLVTTLLLSLLLPARLSAAGSSYLVKDIYPGGFGGDPHQMITINGLLYFEATDDIYGMELWKSDGTATGTSLVKDINPGAASAFDAYSDWVLGLTPIGDTLYFVADDGSHGRELWKSDGTTNGTVRITDLNPGVGHAFNSYATPQFTYISQLQPINQQLYFQRS
jgi:ELWxxDGT repeat protein